MKLEKKIIEGVYVIEPELKTDERGYFFRVFCKKDFAEMGIDYKIVQINRSLNIKKGTLRGMHFQKSPKAEDKIIQCIKGAVYDVAVDLRSDSETFGQWIAEELTEENKKMFLIPKGFAHGYQALRNDSEVLYFSSEFYSPEHVGGVRWDDPVFNIKWPVKEVIISEKDKSWPLFKKA